MCVGVLDGVMFFLCLLLFGFCVYPTAHAAAENPLAYRPVESPPVARLVGGKQNILVKGVLLPLSFYAKILSRVDGDRCPSYPTCSLYARQAVDRHGALVGLWMTVDRLIHERTDIARSGPEGRVVRFKDGRVRLLDALDGNDFWW